ncbi:MAG TPA: acyl-CoA thioesterase [Nitriliruptorales bacterium]|nr:acyl-CoA thioesterase [Nitriliruptorales bacterium]
MPEVYEYRHTVTFAETNLVGNVYFTNHVRWQGAARELFLRDHAPTVLDDLRDGLALVTVYTHVDYFRELEAFDRVVVAMRLEELVQNRIALGFEYFHEGPRGRELVARGRQGVAAMTRAGGELIPVPVPAELSRALGTYASADGAGRGSR